MNLGPRLALITTLLMAATLGLSAWSLVQFRRADLRSDIHVRAQLLGRALKVGLEPLGAKDAKGQLEARRAALAAAVLPFALELIWTGPGRPEDQGWSQLVEAAQIGQTPVGRFFAPDKRPAFYAMAIPLRDGPKSENGKTVAVLGLRLSTQAVDEAAMKSFEKALPWLLGGLVAFGAVMLLLLRTGVETPLRRLNEAIEGVAQGDLTRAILPQQDDEIGVLAGRFNAMTESLREARSEQERATGARLAMESRLRHSEKLATMGQMAAQIAHELGTPLNVIGGRARGLEKKANDPQEVRKNAEIIAVQVDRISRIIRQMLSFSRKSRPALSEVDVAAIIKEALEFVEDLTARQRVTIELRLEPGVDPIPGDPAEIQQVCLNLLNNALQAMPEGGQLQVTVSQVLRRKEGLALSPPAPFLMIEVADTGAGVPLENRERVFEPFFTTKDNGQGTGLGLAVSQGIVKDHDGWMEVGDRPQGGAAFRVFLPVVADPSGSTELALDPGMSKDQ